MSTDNLIAEITNVTRHTVGTNDDKLIYYSGSITSDIIREITFVPAREDPNIKEPNIPIEVKYTNGYQRIGVPSRMRKFMLWLNQHSTFIIPPVILSTRGNWLFESSHERTANYGKLLIKDPAAIIDGQHRIGGFIYKFASDEVALPIPFMAIESIDIDREQNEFGTLNSYQARVPPSLMIANAAVFDTDDDYAWIATEMANSADSPFYGKIGVQRMGSDQLFSLAAVKKNLERTFKHGAIEQLEAEVKLEYAKSFWQCIHDWHEMEWEDINLKKRDMRYKLLETTGLIAWSIVAPDIIVASLDDGAVDWENVRTLISKSTTPGSNGKLDWQKSGTYAGRTGEVGGALIASALQRMIFR